MERSIKPCPQTTSVQISTVKRKKCLIDVVFWNILSLGPSKICETGPIGIPSFGQEGQWRVPEDNPGRIIL